ncbi:hypothetical protein E3N88_28686 [Mikania micrantha]|uniref:Uncharacterized protein n=1 Tax=Mikania micrantha TaxID=192012 RepID=A0A5N6N301_9ASTR|nr:hypothetical protein E3N88_28686 [Mikania micrantha]
MWVIEVVWAIVGLQGCYWASKVPMGLLNLLGQQTRSFLGPDNRKTLTAWSLLGRRYDANRMVVVVECGMSNREARMKCASRMKSRMRMATEVAQQAGKWPNEFVVRRMAAGGFRIAWWPYEDVE